MGVAIPPRPVNVKIKEKECPKGTFDTIDTCYCEDHCSWKACRLVNPPINCLSNINDNTVWGWDPREKLWRAQGNTHLELLVINQNISNLYYKIIFPFFSCLLLP